jgi:Leucine-rich repeat (LRR) protein
LDRNKLQKSLFPVQSRKIKVISIADNQLNDMSALKDWKLPSITELTCCGNSFFGVLPEMALPTLLKLNLSNNALTDISCLGTSELDSLTVLSLANNKLTEFPALRFMRLEQLDVSDNQIYEASKLEQSQLPRL